MVKFCQEVKVSGRRFARDVAYERKFVCMYVLKLAIACTPKAVQTMEPGNLWLWYWANFWAQCVSRALIKSTGDLSLKGIKIPSG